MRTVLNSTITPATSSTSARKLEDIRSSRPCGHSMKAKYRHAGTRPRARRSRGSNSLFGQDQLVVAGMAQPIDPVAVADEDLALPLQQSCAVQCIGHGGWRNEGSGRAHLPGVRQGEELHVHGGAPGLGMGTMQMIMVRILLSNAYRATAASSRRHTGSSWRPASSSAPRFSCNCATLLAPRITLLTC